MDRAQLFEVPFNQSVTGGTSSTVTPAPIHRLVPCESFRGDIDAHFSDGEQRPQKATGYAYGAATPASDHLPIARRSARANDNAAKTLLFEVPIVYYVIDLLSAALPKYLGLSEPS